MQNILKRKFPEEEVILEHGDWKIIKQSWSSPIKNNLCRLLVAHKGHSVWDALEQCCNEKIPDIIIVTVKLMGRYNL